MTDSLVHQCLAEAIQHAVDGDKDHCVTLEGRANDSVWVQLTWDSINAAYPHDAEPKEYLKRMQIAVPAGVELVQWESGTFATFEHAAEPLEPIVRFVEAYLERVLNIAPSEISLNVKRESL